MGGLTHTNGDIKCCKWFQAIAAWLQFEVDIILFSEMQPSDATTDTPKSPYILEYNADIGLRPVERIAAIKHAPA